MSNSSATPWTVAHQTPLSMGFPRKEYSSGSLFPFLRGLPNPGIKLTSPALASGFLTTDPARKSWASLVAQLVRNPPTMQKIWVQSRAWRSPEEGEHYQFQYSGLENSMDWIVHGVAKSRTRLSNFHFHQGSPIYYIADHRKNTRMGEAKSLSSKHYLLRGGDKLISH